MSALIIFSDKAQADKFYIHKDISKIAGELERCLLEKEIKALEKVIKTLEKEIKIRAEAMYRKYEKYKKENRQ